MTSRKTFASYETDGSRIAIPVDAATAALIPGATKLVLEEIFINLREAVVWPEPPAAAPISTQEPTDPSEAPGAVSPAKANEARNAQPTRRGPVIGGAVAGLIIGAAITLTLMTYFAREGAGNSSILSSQSQAALRKGDGEGHATNPAEEKLWADLTVSETALREQGIADAAALKAVGHERDQLKSELTSVQADLDAARKSPPAVPPSPSSSDVEARAASLDQELSALRVDHAQALQRIARQETLIQQRDEEIRLLEKGDGNARGLASVSASPPPGPSPEVLEELNRLRSQIRELEDRSREQTATISDMVVDRAALRKQIYQLEQQVALRSANSGGGRLSGAPAQGQPSRLQNQLDGQSLWGASVEGRDGQVHSINNQISFKAAEEIAQKLCKGASGPGCEILKVFTNECLAVARVRGEPLSHRLSWTTAADWNQAEYDALGACAGRYRKSCKVAYSICSSAAMKPE